MYPTEVRTAIGSTRMSCPSTSAVPAEGETIVVANRRSQSTHHSSISSAKHADCYADSLVSIPDGDFGHARCLGNFLLRTRLVAEDCGNVDRGRGHATRRHAGCEFVLLDLVEDFLRLPLNIHVQLEAVAEPGDVVARTLREELKTELAHKRPIRPSDRLPV